MEIKGIVFDRYIKNTSSVNSAAAQKKVNDSSSESTTLLKEQSSFDKVSVTSSSTFFAKYSNEIKKSAATAKSNIEITPSKLEELKQKYACDNCPTSNEEIASSLLNRIFLV